MQLDCSSKTPTGDRNSYYTFAARLLSDDIEWDNFQGEICGTGRQWNLCCLSLCYNEGSIEDIRKHLLTPIGLNERFNTETGICPKAEKIQPQLMQFTTNQKDEEE